MGAANYSIKQQDRSVVLAAMDGIYALAVVISDQGYTEPYLVTSPTEHEDIYGKAHPSNGVSQYGVNTYLSESNKIWVNRAIHDDAKYAAALVRSKVDSLPLGIPNGSWKPDRIVSPLENGLTDEEFKAYQFPVYHTDRVYSKLTAKLVEPVTNVKAIRVTKNTEFVKDDRLYLGDDPQNDSPLYTVTKVEDIKVNFDKLTLDALVTVKKGDKIRMVAFENRPIGAGVTVTLQALSNTNRIQLSEVTDISINDVLVIGDIEVQVQSMEDKEVIIKGTLEKTVEGGTTVLKKETLYKEYQGNPKVTRDMTGSNEILVSKTDYIGNGDIIAIGEDGHIVVSAVTVKRKDTYNEVHHYIHLDNDYTGNTDTTFNKMIVSEFEDRDAFLVTYKYLSKNGKYVSVAIAPSKVYTEEDVTEDFLLPFNVLVYYKGILVESFENVAMKYQLDDNGNQLFIENVINNRSKYINVKVNPMNVDENGVPRNPAYTNYSIWRKLPEDLFKTFKDYNSLNDVAIIEDLLAGDINVRVNDNQTIAMGDRIKFEGYAEEYKVVNKNSYSWGGSTLYEITLDREIIITADNTIRKIPAGVKVTKFNAADEDSVNGVYAGVQHFRPSKIDNVYYNYPLNVIFTIGNDKGTLLDSGANLLLGGSNGSPVTVADIIKALKPFYNKDKYPAQVLLDTGHTYPAYAQELNALAKHRGTAHAYVSIDINAEKSANYKKDIVDYYNKLMLNSEYTSVFAGWIRALDENNNIELYIDPASAAGASQAFTTRDYQIFYPAAGWTRGKVKGLGVVREFSAGDLDYLVDNRINPIRYKAGSGLVIWGNETTYRKPSPLQIRSVNWLLIMIKYGLESTLEFSLFELLNDRTIDSLETAIRTFMRDEVKAKGGVYDFQVEASKIITDSDREQRRLPVFLGVKPTVDSKYIPVTLAVFSASQKIDVSL